MMERLPPPRSYESSRSSRGAPSQADSSFTHGSRDIRKTYTVPQHAVYHGSTYFAPSDSVYLDLERSFLPKSMTGSTAEAVSRFSPVVTPRPPEPIYREEMDDSLYQNTSSYSRRIGLDRLPGRTYQAYQSPTKQKPLVANENTPILFGDPFDQGSIMTGLSQQELLRKKAREDDKYKKGKKKRKELIINMPAMMLGGSKATKYYNANHVANSKEGKIALPKKAQNPVVQNIIGKTKQSSWGHHVVTRASEELDISTAESTRSTENNNGEIDLPYSTVPAQNAIVNEADGATMVEDWGAVRTNLDVQSWGEDSFPILSNHATTFSLAGEEYSERPVRISIDSAQDSRVRFSGKVSVEKLAYEPNDSSGEIPWDEGGDVAVGVAEYTSSAMQDPPARLMTPQTKNDSSGQPKSILRPSRFSQQPNTSRFTHAARSLGKRVDDDSVATPLNPLNTSAVIKSPPRNGTGFLEHGIELSPIERAVTQAFGHPAEKGSAAAFQEIMRQANCLYPVGNVVEDGSLYSDPTLDVMNRDDDSTVMSTMGFIRTVAAIVIQTAFRRYKAVCLLERLRKSATTPKMGRKVSDLKRTAPQPWAIARAVPAVSSSDDYEAMATRMYELAAIRIQSAFRGFWVRDCISVDHYCAKVIQQAFRRHLRREQYLFDLDRIVVVQSVWRRNIARVMVADRLWRIIKVQAVCRGYLARRKPARSSRKKWPVVRTFTAPKQIQRSYRPVAPVVQKSKTKDAKQLAKENRAATLIQAEWRCYMYQSEFIRSLVDVLIVQSIVRRWLAIRFVRQLRPKRLNRFVANQQRTVQRSAPKPSGFMTKPPRSMYTVRNVSKVTSSVTHNLSGIEPWQKPSNGLPIVSPVSESGPKRDFDSTPETVISAGGTKSILSLWKDREQKALAVAPQR